MWVRIPPGAWMFVCCECCVLSGRCLCDKLITRPEKSCRLWCVVVRYLETSWMRRSWPTGGCRAKSRQTDIEESYEITVSMNIHAIRLKRFWKGAWLIGFIGKVRHCSDNRSTGTSRLLCNGTVLSRITAIWCRSIQLRIARMRKQLNHKCNSLYIHLQAGCFSKHLRPSDFTKHTNPKVN
jgi:hypothetical protein